MSRRRPRPVGHLLMPNQVTALLLPAHVAIANLGTTAFTAATWHELACFGDVVQLLAVEEGRQDVLSLAQQVNETLIAIHGRFKRLGKWGATGPEQQFLRAAINPLDAFFRRQRTHKVRAALLRLDAALAAAEVEGNTSEPIVITPDAIRRPDATATTSGANP